MAEKTKLKTVGFLGANWRYFVVGGIVALMLTICGVVIATTTEEQHIARLIVLGIGIFVSWFAIGSIKVVPATKVAILMYSDQVSKLLKSGPWFVPMWFGKLKLFPTDLLEIDIKDGTVMTKKGLYEFVDKEGEPQQEICEQDSSKFDITIYMSFPWHSLSKLVRIMKANVPTDLEELKKWIDTGVNSAVSVVGSRMTWREFSMEKARLVEEIAEELDSVLFASSGFEVLFDQYDEKEPPPSESEEQKQKREKGERKAKRDRLKEKAKENPGLVFLMVERSEPSEKLKNAIQMVNVEALQELSAESDAREIAKKSAGAFVLGVQQSFGFQTLEDAAKHIKNTPELQQELLSTLSSAIRDHIAGTEGNLIRVSVDRGGNTGAGGQGGNFLSDAVTEGIALLAGVKDCKPKDRLQRILGGDATSGSSVSEDSSNSGLLKWAKDMGYNPNDEEEDDEFEADEADEAEASDSAS